MIIVRNLCKRYPSGSQVLNKMSFQVDEGDFIVIVGGSGSGKSTLLRCLSLDEKWDDGQYIYNGRDITSLNPLDKWRVKKEWAKVEEKPNLNPTLSPLKNVMTARLFQTLPWKTISKDNHMEAMDMLEQVGLLDKARMKTSQLSGGEQQRVGIARALVQGAKVLYADEPVTGLDPKSADRMLEDLRNLCRNKKATVIITLHKLELAERFAGRIWGIAGGKLAVDIPARKLTVSEKKQIFG
ncbi:phosphonates import ATP-binding protein PhnC [Paenibacillus sp. J31TS4]|uniref:phosphonate ABC transporter ATP-binding protein n=1 Tax=Paenibacillus sp. J31TS4 TaxID=2807195 RepID=UPI001AFCF780|nr:ATP-binding cassette domain-containing protein [Paenibacillus sp. J31TS4]GIP37204.1 phosphonates import ATP-binding protein PhnC [Paenibacillus sp. J31TS4]